MPFVKGLFLGFEGMKNICLLIYFSCSFIFWILLYFSCKFTLSNDFYKNYPDSWLKRIWPIIFVKIWWKTVREKRISWTVFVLPAFFVLFFIMVFIVFWGHVAC